MMKHCQILSCDVLIIDQTQFSIQCRMLLLTPVISRFVPFGDSPFTLLQHRHLPHSKNISIEIELFHITAKKILNIFVIYIGAIAIIVFIVTSIYATTIINISRIIVAGIGNTFIRPVLFIYNGGFDICIILYR